MHGSFSFMPQYQSANSPHCSLHILMKQVARICLNIKTFGDDFLLSHYLFVSTNNNNYTVRRNKMLVTILELKGFNITVTLLLIDTSSQQKLRSNQQLPQSHYTVLSSETIEVLLSAHSNKSHQVVLSSKWCYLLHWPIKQSANLSQSGKSATIQQKAYWWAHCTFLLYQYYSTWWTDH